MSRPRNKNWPTITFLDIAHGFASALHFQLEHGGKMYNDEKFSMSAW